MSYPTRKLSLILFGLGRLLKFVERSPDYALWIATSMGQAATDASEVQTQVYLQDVGTFMRSLGFTPADWREGGGKTPILAAGDGTVELVGGKGGYGNYVRIRHPNGYSTAYGHMSRYADGVAPGVAVKQGQIIGYVGSTGMSTGPHCHFEVLVNNNFVNPMTIAVPRGLQLEGRELAEFQKERSRIDALMQMDPVTSRVATAQ
jgi:hypothetical protein